MPLRLCLAVFTSALLGGSASAQILICDGGSLESRQLYYEDAAGGRPCWRKPTFVETGEFSRADRPVAAVKLENGVRLSFVYVLQGERPTASGLVVKERYFRPGVIFGEPGRGPTKDPQATRRVYLDRPSVSNRCNSLPDLNANRGVGMDSSAGFREFNQYHTIRDALPTDDVRELHFAYPLGERTSDPCRKTDDWDAGNRGQYRLIGVEAQEAAPGVAGLGTRMGRLVGRAKAGEVINDTDIHLRVRNIYWPKETGLAASMIRFRADGIARSRLEVTLVDLENRVPGGRHDSPQTWQLDIK